MDTLNGLPAHVLLLHVVVVMIPLASIALLLHVFSPKARRRLGIVTPLLAFVALVFVPLTTSAGEWLQHRVPDSQLVHDHTELGDQLLPFAAALFLVSVAVWAAGRYVDGESVPLLAPKAEARAGEHGGSGAGATATATAVLPARTLPKWAQPVLSVLSVVVVVLALIWLYRIGDSGAKAAWDYVKHVQPHGGGDG
ncbi:MAG: hypothetical protein ACTHMS_19540 [Jatrophihabitans sp.]|uniref:hypothetical protein n=1 Tax=Jatrophihabitans sp. TaxID=1932789 RepID=UPI003F7CF5DB